MEEGLKIILSADGSEVIKTFQQMQNELKGFKEQLANATNVDQINQLSQAISNTERQIQVFQRMGQAAQTSGLAIYQARDAVMDLGHVARDLPYAADNIAILAGPIGRITTLMQGLKDETGSLKGAFGALGGALSGGGGVVIGLELAMSALAFLGKSFMDSNSDVDEFKVKMEDLNATLKETGKEISDVVAAMNFANTLGALNAKANGIGDLTDLRGQMLAADDALLKVTKDATDLSNQKIHLSIQIESAKGDAEPDPKLLDQLKQQLDAVTAAYDSAFKQQTDLENKTRMLRAQIEAQKNKDAEDALKKQQEANKKAEQEALRHEREMEKAILDELNRMKAIRMQQVAFTAPDKVNLGLQPEYGYSANPQIQDDIKKTFQNIQAVIPIHPEFVDDGKWHKGFDNLMRDSKGLEKEINGVLTPAFEGMFKAIEEGKDPLKAFFDSVIQSIEQVIEKLIVAAAEAAIFSALSGGATSFTSEFTKILGFSEGGIVPGSGNSDTVPAMLTPGELVIPKNMVASFISTMKSANNNLGLKGLEVPAFNMPTLQVPNFAMPSMSSPVGGGASDRISQSVSMIKMQPIDITVNGVFRAQGKDLVAVHQQTLKSQGRTV